MSSSKHNEYSSDSVGYWRTVLTGALQTLAHALNDITKQQEGVRLAYHLDFSLLAPEFFPKRGTRSQPAKPGVADAIHWILKKESPITDCPLALSAATYYEFVGMYNKQFDTAQKLTDLNESLVNQITNGDILTKTPGLRHKLSLLTEKGRDSMTREPAERLLNLLDKRVLTGLGDSLDYPDHIPVKKIRDTFDEIATDEVSIRKQRQIGRSSEEIEFHSKIDAASIVLSLYYSKAKSSQVIFVTETIRHIEHCRKGDQLFGRHFYVPLHLCNLSHLEEEGRYFRNKVSFLEKACREVSDLILEIKHYEDDLLIYELPEHALRWIVAVNHNYLEPLLETTDTSEGSDHEELDEEIRNIVNDRSKLRNSSDDAIDQIKEMVSSVSNSKESFGIAYAEQIGLAEDPIIKRIKNRFDISKV